MTSRRQLALLLPVTLIHVFLVFGPLVYLLIYEKFNPPKPEPFRVKLGGLTPSHAPEVGPPERTRGPANPEPPAPEPVAPEAPAPEPVAPEPPAPVPEPVAPKPVAPAPKPKPKSKPKSKPKPKPKPKAEVKPKPQVKPKPAQKKQTASQKKTAKTPVPPKKRTVRDLQNEVYRPAGGGNTNISVPIGSHDRGQKFGPQDNKTPMGGASADMERYWKVMRLYLYDRWKQPPKSLLGNAKPTAEIELRVSPDGRVLSARLVRGSGNAVMDDSVQNLLKTLDRIPAPPDGELNFTIELAIE